MAKKKQQLTAEQRELLAERKRQERIKFQRNKRGILSGISEFRKTRLARASKRKAAYGSNYDDTVPYRTDSIQRNATFESRGDESFHRYYSAPRGIQVGLIGGESDNQIALLDMVRNIAKDLDAQPATSLKKSVKRGFHIQATRRSLTSGVPFPEGISNAQRQYLEQCNEYRPMADWTLNMGFRLELFGTNSNQFTVSDRLKSNARQAVMRSESVREEIMSRYAMDSRRLTDVVTQAGFEEIDFTDPKINPRDRKLHDLTSWMCNDDEMLENTKLSFPLYGTSAHLPRFDEVAFYTVSEKQENRKSGRYYTPGEYGLRYAREFFNPENRVVHFSIRGEIVSMKNTREEMRISEDSAFDVNEDTKYQEQVRLSQLRDTGKKLDISSAASVAAMNNPLIVDSFTLIAVRVHAGEEPPIVARLRDSTTYNLEVNPVAGNVPDAVHATLPGFNKPIFTSGSSHMWSLKNSLATEKTFPGRVFLSGVFNSSVPPVKSGIYLGLTNAFEEYKPFFLDTKQISSATKGENNPGILVTGRPDAGKTTLIKQIAKQAENNGEFCALLNFKSIDPLAPWWDEVIKDGAIVTIDPRLLSNKAGCLDPFNFYDRGNPNDWPSISATISGAISLLLRQNGVHVPSSTIDAMVTDNVRNPYSRCAGDVIFGARKHRAHFKELEDTLRARNATDDEISREFIRTAAELETVCPLVTPQVRKIVREAMRGSQSPFWRAFVADDVMVDQQIARAVNSGKPLLFEWGENFTPPSREVSLDAMTATEFDAVQSAMVVLGYVKRAANRFSKSTGKGGLIMMDEGAGALHITEFAAEVERIMREFRAIGMRFLIGSQLSVDVKEQIRSFCSLHIFGAISRVAPDAEMEQFFRTAEIAESKRGIAREFILTAGRTSEDDGGDIAERQMVQRPIPYAWVVDQINNVNRPMLMGEYPLSVLTGAMSAAQAREIERQLQEVSWSEKDEMVEQDREAFEIGYR